MLPAPGALIINRTLQLRAIGHYDDATTEDLTGALPRVTRIGGRTAHPAALDQTGLIALAPGTIKLVPRLGAAPAAIAGRTGLALRRAFPALGVAFLDVPEGQDLVEAAARVRADPGVSEAEVELVEGALRPL